MSAGREFLDFKALARLARIPLAARGLVEGTFAGAHKSPHKGASVEFAQYREYVPGDDVRNVDWRLWGRTDRHYVKEFEADTNMRCLVAVDCSGSMGYGGGQRGNKLFHAKCLAASLAYLAARQGDAPGLALFADKILRLVPPRHHPSHLRNIFDCVEKARPEGGTAVWDVLHEIAENTPKRSFVAVFSDFLADLDGMAAALSHCRYRRHDLVLFHILDPDEINFPLAGVKEFVSLEGHLRLSLDAAAVRRRYLDNLASHLAGMRDEARKFDVELVQAHSTHSPEQILADFLKRRRGAARATKAA